MPTGTRVWPKRFCVRAVAALLLAGCSVQKPLVHIPPQRAAIDAQDPPQDPAYADFSNPAADRWIVRDIAKGEGSGWKRWTGANPAVRVPAEGASVAEAEFELVPATFDTTGPVAVALFADGRKLTEARYEKTGTFQLKAPVAASAGPMEVSLTVDPVFIAPGDGAKLGVRLTGMGLRRP
jgi:hypothetical protein